ncbi:AMP-binding enzyme [Cupriavidus basilensis]
MQHRPPRPSRSRVLPRLLAQRGGHRGQVPGARRLALVPHRRPCARRRGWLPLVPGPRRRGRSSPPAIASGRAEIENCLLKHPAVSNCAVVPSPDPGAARWSRRSSYCLPSVARSAQADAELVAELQQHVRGQLAPYEYPKAIEFLDQLPMTTTGKIQRRVLREIEARRGTPTRP